MSNWDKFLKYKNNQKKFLRVGVLFFILSILLLIIGFFYENREVQNAVNLHELIYNNQKDENLITYIDVAHSPYVFAEYSTNEKEEKYYFLWDKEDYIYIALLDYNTYKTLEKSSTSNPIKIYGKTILIENTIKELALETYNEEFENSLITSSNFEEYFGAIALSTVNPIYDASLFYIIGFISSILGFCFIITYVFSKRKIMKDFDRLSDLEKNQIKEELNREDTIYREKEGFAYTKRHVILFSQKFLRIAYEDIVILYPFYVKQNGITVSASIHGYMKNGKKFSIGNFHYFSKNSKTFFEEMMRKLIERCPYALIGFTKENKMKIEEKYAFKVK